MPRLVKPVIETGSIGSSVQPDIPLDSDHVLRPWEPRDVGAVIRAFSDPDIQRWHVRRMDSEAEAEAWVAESHEAWISETGAWWAIAQIADRAVAGRVAIYLKPESGHGEVSYWVLPHARRQGLATRACLAATRWAHTKSVSIESSCNTPSTTRAQGESPCPPGSARKEFAETRSSTRTAGTMSGSTPI